MGKRRIGIAIDLCLRIVGARGVRKGWTAMIARGEGGGNPRLDPAPGIP